MSSKPTYEELLRRVEALETRASDSYRELYTTLMANIPDIIVRMDLQGTILEINQAGLQISGYEPGELEGRNMLDFIAPEDRQRAISNTVLMFQQKLGPQNYHLLMKDGRKLPFEVNGDILRDQTDTPTGMVHICRDITARMRAQEAIDQAENRYLSVIDNSHDGIVFIDDSFHMIYANYEFCRIMGYGREEMLGKDFRKFLAPETAHVVINSYKIRQEGLEAPSRYEFMIVRKDGQKRWVETSSTVIVDSQNRKQSVAQLIDVTERKQSQEEQRLNSERMEALLVLNQMRESSLERLAAFTMEEAVRLTNSRIGYLAFASPDESMLIMHAWSKAAMAECAIVDKPIEYLVKDTGLWGEAVRQRRPVITNDYQAANSLKRGTPTGHVKMLRHMNVPIFEGDKIVIVAGVGNKEGEYDESDVHQLTLLMQGMWRIVRQKQAEEALRESEERLEIILKASPDPVVVYDTDGLATYINPAFTRVFGWQAEEVLGKRIPFVPESEMDGTLEVIHKLYREGNPVTYRTKRLTKTGEVLSIVISAAGIVDETGKITGMVVDLTDVTHTEQLESQLRQSQKMEAIGVLAGGIAHDFNNLLGVILGYADRAQTRMAHGKSGDFEVTQIINAAQRAAQLVQQILTFSRRSRAVMRPVTLNLEVEQVVAILGRTIPKMIKIDIDLDQDLKLINCDVDQVELVLLNLANNAVDAMPEGGQLTIRTSTTELDSDYQRLHPEVRPGRYVLLEVDDTGTGMDQTTLQHIFEPFYTTKEVGKGTGLGLSTVYGIVTNHGGHITCDSELGRGTTIKTFWPVYEGKLSHLRPDDPFTARRVSGSETILLVDDEDALRDIAKEALLEMGYQVQTANSGEKALALYRELTKRPDLVILDLGMPGMGGRRCLKEILRLDPGAKVLIASGYAVEGVRDEALREGAAGFLAKPFRIAELLATVREMLDQNGNSPD